MEKPACKLINEDSNIFNIIGIVKRTLRREGTPENQEAFNSKLEELMTGGGSYDDILVLVQEYVDVV